MCGCEIMNLVMIKEKNQQTCPKGSRRNKDLHVWKKWSLVLQYVGRCMARKQLLGQLHPFEAAWTMLTAS